MAGDSPALQDQAGDTKVDLLASYYLARMTTIGAGTSELNRNIVARRVLRLPDR